MISKHSKLLPVSLAILLGVLLLVSVPLLQALNVYVTSAQFLYNTGTTAHFNSTIILKNGDLFTIDSIQLSIIYSSNSITAFSCYLYPHLFNASVTSKTFNNVKCGSQTINYTFIPGFTKLFGYGYGYGYDNQTVGTFRYNFTWNIPDNYTSGNYSAEVYVHGPDIPGYVNFAIGSGSGGVIGSGGHVPSTTVTTTILSNVSKNTTSTTTSLSSTTSAKTIQPTTLAPTNQSPPSTSVSTVIPQNNSGSNTFVPPAGSSPWFLYTLFLLFLLLLLLLLGIFFSWRRKKH